MNLFFIMIAASICSSISTYIDKFIVNFGINRKTYFFFMCLTIIPFAFFSLWFEPIRFQFDLIPIVLLGVAMVLRYYKQQSIVGILTYLEPHEVTTYMSLSILLAYVIDCILSIKYFSVFSIFAIFLILFGVFSLSKVKLSIKSLRFDLIVRIVTDLGIGYVAFYILKFWSNSIYILILNLLLVFVNLGNKKIQFRISKKLFLLLFVQQIFGFGLIYLANYLSSHAVIYSQMVKPIALIFTTLFSFIIHMKNKPSKQDLFYILLVIIGLVVLELN